MTEPAERQDEIRERILAQPDVILEDPTVMRALIEANERSLGSNIVDLRGIAMARLEARLDRLEDTHRNVVAAAYENLAGTNLVHRAILRMFEPTDFASFLLDLGGDVAGILQVDVVRLVLESDTPDNDPALARFAHVLSVREAGFVEDYVTRSHAGPMRKIALRQTRDGDADLYGEAGDWIRSEACLTLDLGPGRLPGMLAMGAEDPHQFSPIHGTDLLSFFGGALERAIRRWLA